jgi:hypothetical protein
MSDESKLYYGVDKVPKGKKRASMIQAVKAKQVRYYGVKKVDPRLLAYYKKHVKYTEEEARMKYFTHTAIVRTLVKRIKEFKKYGDKYEDEIEELKKRAIDNVKKRDKWKKIWEDLKAVKTPQAKLKHSKKVATELKKDATQTKTKITKTKKKLKDSMKKIKKAKGKKKKLLIETFNIKKYEKDLKSMMKQHHKAQKEYEKIMDENKVIMELFKKKKKVVKKKKKTDEDPDVKKVRKVLKLPRDMFQEEEYNELITIARNLSKKEKKWNIKKVIEIFIHDREDEFNRWDIEDKIQSVERLQENLKNIKKLIKKGILKPKKKKRILDNIIEVDSWLTHLEDEFEGSGFDVPYGGAYTAVQSILIKKSYGLPKAKKWIKKNKFKLSKVHKTKNYYRFRQESPKSFKRFRMKDINKNIKFLIGIK